MTYLLDTSVVIDGVNNIQALSENGKNKIIISDIVLAEADNLKTSPNVGFMARKFNAFLQTLEIIKTHDTKEALISELRSKDILIDLVSFKEYKTQAPYPSMLNDRRLCECAIWASSYYLDLVLVSSDAALRAYALSKQIRVKSLRLSQKDADDISFVKTIKISQEALQKLEFSPASELGLERSQKSIIFELENSHKVLANVINEKIEFINEDALRASKLPPKNVEQIFLANLIMSNLVDVVVSSSVSGSGKTALCVAYGFKLIDSPNTIYEKLIYIRNPIDSVDKEAAIGFKKGDLSEKLEGFFSPLNDTLEFFARNELRKQNKSLDKQSVDLKIADYIKRYDISFPYIGNLRGTNLNRAVIVIDEAQNFSLSAMQLVLTRVADSSKVLVIGDINQVDSLYLSKNNNALSFLLHQSAEPQTLNIAGIKLSKTVRGKVCEWAEELFSKNRHY